MKRPDKSTHEKFNQMISVPQPPVVLENSKPEQSENLMFVSETDLAKHNDKTKFYLRIAEIVQVKSAVIVTRQKGKEGERESEKKRNINNEREGLIEKGGLPEGMGEKERVRGKKIKRERGTKKSQKRDDL